MTQAQWRAAVVDKAEAWLGCSEENGGHREIIDLYNSVSPLPRGYAVKYSDPWCAAFASAVAIALGLEDIIPPECSCEWQIRAFQALGRWQEDGTVTPEPGDYVYYNWDSAQQPNNGVADHVGIVTAVYGESITVVEGNCGDTVCYRSLRRGWGHIRGYAKPDYAALADTAVDAWAPEETPGTVQGAGESTAAPDTPKRGSVELPWLRGGEVSEAVRSMQLLLIHGWAFGCGADGADGDFGPNTLAALHRFQSCRGLREDGCGPETWGALIEKETT